MDKTDIFIKRVEELSRNQGDFARDNGYSPLEFVTALLINLDVCEFSWPE